MAEVKHTDFILDNHPNFRPIDGTILYRSSALDDISQDQIEKLHDRGVKAIIDLRSPTSWENSGTPSPTLVDYFYTPVVVTSRRGQFQKANLFTESQMDTLTPNTGTERGAYGYRYYLNIIDIDFGYGVARESPWYRQVQLLGLGIGYLFGNMTITKKIPSWCLKKEGETMLLSVYKGIVNYSGARLANAFRLLHEQGSEPVVVTCMQGKDRTGILSALLQHICGQDRETILQGYAKTEAALEALKPGLIEMSKQNGFDETFVTANRETMEQLLQFFNERYGGMTEYLRSIGINADDQESLRKIIQNKD